MTISAKIVADSKSDSGSRITTFELEYPRFVHSELMTHRVFSRNAASSRAIPVNRAIELIKEDTAMPIHWGKNQPGMSAKEECNKLLDFVYEANGSDTPWPNVEREHAWNIARDNAIHIAETFSNAGYHKQIVNRLLEPFTHIKVVVTSTEFDNFFWLRNHEDAQPEIHVLASRMYMAYSESNPTQLRSGEWHLPYYNNGYWKPTDESMSKNFQLSDEDLNLSDSYGNTLEDALAISSSCCAQVSYRRLDDSLEKARNIYNRLIAALPPHFSPFEHQASPMDQTTSFDTKGVTHMDRQRNYWSGNFKNWIQHRQLIMDDLNIEHMTASPKNLKEIDNE